MFISSPLPFAGHLKLDEALHLAKSCIASHPELNKIFQVAALKFREMEATLADGSTCYSKFTGKPKQASVLHNSKGHPIAVDVPLGYMSLSETEPDAVKEMYAGNLICTALAQFDGWMRVSPASLKTIQVYAEIQWALSHIPHSRDLLISLI